MKILVLSDTHGYIDERILHYAKAADQVWHAGDIGNINVINELNKISELKIVYGNIDNYKLRVGLEKLIFFKVGKFNVLITHIYNKKLFDEMTFNKNSEKKYSNILVCGHSHILKVMPDKKLSLLHMNPGAVGKHGFHKVRTMLRFTIDGKKIDNLEVIEFDKR